MALTVTLCTEFYQSFWRYCRDANITDFSTELFAGMFYRILSKSVDMTDVNRKLIYTLKLKVGLTSPIIGELMLR
jgi:hypothetical protein